MYGVEDKFIKKAAHIKAFKQAEKDFLNARNTLYDEAKAANPELFPRSETGYVKMFEALDKGKHVLQEALSQKISEVAISKGLHVASELQYFTVGQSLNLN